MRGCGEEDMQGHGEKEEGDAARVRRITVKAELFDEDERTNAQAFGERHADDGLDENLARSSGIAANGFSGFEADETDAQRAAEETERGADVALEFSDDVHVMFSF